LREILVGLLLHRGRAREKSISDYRSADESRATHVSRKKRLDLILGDLSPIENLNEDCSRFAQNPRVR
jgi:hypothetical protein